jgi:tRNA threonylcarbamoyladenosine biosynthesis protein TsaE
LSTTESSSPADTEAAGARLAERLRPGDVVLVRGELGAGKTTFVRGAARALGVEGPVTSPTFTVGRRYAGRVPVSHLDLYRLGDMEAEDPGLLDEYLARDAVAFVEWPDAIIGDLPGAVVRTFDVRIAHDGGDARRIDVEGGGG